MKQTVGIELKRLRESTFPRLSVRELAKKLGIGPTTYQHYEDRFKGDLLPIPLVEKLLPVLVSHGVPREAIIALSGAADIMNAPSNINTMLLGECLETIEKILAEDAITLPSQERAALTIELYKTGLDKLAPDLRGSAFRLVLRHLSNERKQQT